MSDFKISICSASYGRADLFTIADRLAALGYDGVEITVMYHADPAETSAQMTKFKIDYRLHVSRADTSSGCADKAASLVFFA